MARIGVAVLLVLLSACSIGTEKCTNVNQDTIFQSYSVAYQASDDRTTAEATLRFGQFGTTLEMDGNCDVAHSDFSLSPSSLLGTSYSGSGSGFLADHTFTFTDNNQKTFENSGTLNAIGLGSPSTTVSRGAGVTLTWTGDEVGAEDSVTLYLSGQDGTGASVAASKTVTTQGATSVTMNGSDMTDLLNGPVEMYIVRSSSPSLTQQTSNGGEMFLYYTSERLAVTLTD